MRHAKRYLSCLCAAVLAFFLLLPGIPAAADEITVYQTAVNDQMLELSSDTMPARIGGVLYVPYTVFDKDTTGVSLGVGYGQKKEGGSYTLTLYTIGSLLIFDVNNGTCVDGTGASKDMKAFLRNGKVFVPLGGVCSFLDLKTSYTPTSYGTLVRITSSQAVLSTTQFVDSATSQMRIRYNDYIKSLTPPSPVVSPPPSSSPTTPTRPGTTPETPETPDKRGVRVYLAFQCTDGGGLESILDTLERNGVHALFFFRPADLARNDALVRRIVGSGHAVGLIAAGNDTAAELAEGNRLLERIVRLRTHTVLPIGLSAAAVTELEGNGWVVWSGNVDGLPGSRSQSGLSRAILDGTAAKKNTARITMDDSALSSGALTRLLPQLRRDQYSLRLAVETELG